MSADIVARGLAAMAQSSANSLKRSGNTQALISAIRDNGFFPQSLARTTAVSPADIPTLVWGAAGVWLTPAGDTATMTVVVATLAGVTAIAAFVLHADWPCCIAYTAPMQLPGAMVMLSRGDRTNYFWGGV